MSPAPDERILDLLAARATEGLDADSQRDLSELLRVHPEVDADGFDLAAAALFLAFAEANEAPPTQLCARLARQGRDWMRSRDAE